MMVLCFRLAAAAPATHTSCLNAHMCFLLVQGACECVRQVCSYVCCSAVSLLPAVARAAAGVAEERGVQACPPSAAVAAVVVLPAPLLLALLLLVLRLPLPAGVCALPQPQPPCL